MLRNLLAGRGLAEAARTLEDGRRARCAGWWLARRNDLPRCPAYVPARAR